jgi:hypothetical protein
MKKACENISNNCLRLSCLAHNLNLVVQNGLKIWEKPEAIDKDKQYDFCFIIFYLCKS